MTASELPARDLPASELDLPASELDLPASELPASAQRLLGSDDLEGYGGLFERVEAIADPHRRYWAGVSLAEQGLAARASTTAARLPALLVTLAAGVLRLLERDPSEPRLLSCAGTALLELWSLDAAEALLEASRRLDPQLEDAERSLRELASRRREQHEQRGAAGRPALRAALPELARRSLEIATLAKPAEGLRLSLCMIVRDEEQMLPRCLAAVAGAVDEIVLVDTGSSDATIEIARSFGARVIEHEWSGSFAHARNVSFDAASGDWLMYLDADEVLVREDTALLRSLTGRTWREAFYLSETNYTGDVEDGTAVAHNALRVFRNRPEYRFEGRLHEQIAHRLPSYLPERVETTGVRVEHYGYLGVVRDAREKSRRNIELLRLQQAESPPSAFLHYNLGCEYAAAGEHAAALAELERSWELAEAAPDRDALAFAPTLTSRLAKALRACERPRDALACAEDGLERFPGFTDLAFEQALAAIALGEHDRAVELCERCIEMGDAPRPYTATVGAGSYLPRLRLAELLRAAGELEPAIEQLECCLHEYPQFIGSVLPYASALLAGGVAPDAVVAELERHLPDPAPAARFMLGTALYEGGANGAGEAQFRAVLARQPHSGRARVALAEALLAQRRYREAAEEAAALDREDPLAAIACRTELFARIAGAHTPGAAGTSGAAGASDTSGAAGALERARAAGMAREELDLFTAWHELATSGRTQLQLTQHAVPLLAVMLEALLRVHDFGAFETLLALLERTPVDERKRHELLAEMYMRRGFAASAAQEWMAVCQQEPDTQALLGLARIAAARGMPREASDFAAAALTRDPANEDAASLLSQVIAS
ncbi:MAG TPA: glycosyltransferase [Solirubrobacteraceae bacterium]|nr:glycosyltransferase [Solirubrobacteraceae bacterium]